MKNVTDRFNNTLNIGDIVSFIVPSTHEIADGEIVGIQEKTVKIKFLEEFTGSYSRQTIKKGKTCNRKHTDVFKRPSGKDVVITREKYLLLLELSQRYKNLM
jgi:hypothetical protein